MMPMSPVRDKTPTEGMEMIFDLMPLDLFIQGEAQKALLRTQGHKMVKWDGVGAKTANGHRFEWDKALATSHLLNIPKDIIVTTLNWQKKFVIDETSLKTEGKPVEAEFSCYTDGSKGEKGTGWGYTLQPGSPDEISDKGYLGQIATVFQAEITAINKAAEALQAIEGLKEVTIFCDSQAAILAINQHLIKSREVWSCIEALNDLGNTVKVELRWVKAHVGHEGNERADELAKEGANNPIQGVEPYLGLTKKMVTARVNEITEETWNIRWLAQKDKYRQTKLWFPKRDMAKSKIIVKNLDRGEIGLMVQAITGHNFLKRHEAIITPGKDPMCTLCKEKEESFHHLVEDCPALLRQRRELLMTTSMEVQLPVEWDPIKLLKFIKDPTVAKLMTGVEEEQQVIPDLMDENQNVGFGGYGTQEDEPMDQT